MIRLPDTLAGILWVHSVCFGTTYKICVRIPREHRPPAGLATSCRLNYHRVHEIEHLASIVAQNTIVIS